MTPRPSSRQPPPDYARALTPIEISLALLAGMGGFALVQLLGLVGAGGP